MPALVAAALLAAPAVPAAPRTGPESTEGIEVHFKDTDVAEIVQAIARAAGQRVIFGDELRGLVTITVPTRVSRGEALELLNATLYQRGFAAIPIEHDTLKIVQITEAVSASPVVTRAPDPDGEASITTMIRLRDADPESVVTTLGPFVSRNAVAIAYPPSRSIILSATESQIRRLITIVRVIDRASKEDLMVRVLRHRSARVIAAMVEEVFNMKAPPHHRVEILVDERSTALIARAQPARLEAVREFVADMDRPEEGGGPFRVIRVLNRDAEEIATALRDLGQGASIGRAMASAGRTLASLRRDLAGRDFSIVVDAPTRSLVVRSDPETFDLIASVVAKLDRIPPRISVEALIFEIQRPSSFALGVDFFLPVSNPKGPTDLLAAVGTNLPSQGELLTQGSGVPTAPSQANSLFARWTRAPLLVSFAGANGSTQTIAIPRGDAAFEASEAEFQASVLMRPQLVVVSGEEHEIFAGNNVPVPVSPAPASGDAQAAGSLLGGLDPTATTARQIERHDVGVRLRFKPIAGTDGDVVLDLEIEVSEITPSIAGPVEEVGPTITQRDIEATIRIREGEYAILGTQTGKSVSKSKRGMPFLMDIPFLGFLFGQVVETVREVDLFVLVTARQMNSVEEDIAESIRRRMAFERSISRVADLGTVSDAPYAVLLDSVRDELEAKAIADAFESDGFETRVTDWEALGSRVHDIYIVELRDFNEAVVLARRLSESGWPAEITVLPPENEMAGD